MPNFEGTPRTHITEGEILPHKHLERGEVRTIEAEIEQIRQRAKRLGEFILNVQTYEIDPLEQVISEGYKYILRLPRVNEADCVKKYGGYYDKLKSYFEFIDTLARRNGITRFKHTTDSYYVFDLKEDAELLKEKLIEKQEQVELEFEVIDNDQQSSVADESDSNPD